MEPNSREIKRCKACGRQIFFAVTRAGEWQPLDVKPDPVRGSVLAYRSAPGAWWARSVGHAEQRDDVDQVLEWPPHVLEQRYRPHPETCPKRRRAVVQPPLPGLACTPSSRIDKVKAALPDNVIPLRRSRRP